MDTDTDSNFKVNRDLVHHLEGIVPGTYLVTYVTKDGMRKAYQDTLVGILGYILPSDNIVNAVRL